MIDKITQAVFAPSNIEMCAVFVVFGKDNKPKIERENIVAFGLLQPAEDNSDDSSVLTPLIWDSEGWVFVTPGRTDNKDRELLGFELNGVEENWDLHIKLMLNRRLKPL